MQNLGVLHVYTLCMRWLREFPFRKCCIPISISGNLGHTRCVRWIPARNTWTKENPGTNSTILLLKYSYSSFLSSIVANSKVPIYTPLYVICYISLWVSTELRRHGIPSLFFTSVNSVFRAELAKIPAEFRRIPCRIIPWNSAEFHGIPWLFSISKKTLLIFFLQSRTTILWKFPKNVLRNWHLTPLANTISKFF